MKPDATLSGWHYSTPAILLHWLLAVLISFMAALGWYMMSIEDDPGSDWYFNLHKSVGLIVFTLVALRAVWRLTHRPLALPPSVPGWQAQLATITQYLLYACMVLMPLTGYLGASLSKHGVAFFGTQLPVWLTPDHDTAELFFNAHGVIVWILVALVVLHAAGGLKHLLINRDQVFQRMWW